MAEWNEGQHKEHGKAALAGLPAADRRSDQPDFAQRLDDEEPEPIDPNSILHGARAIGRAAMSAGRMETNPIALYEQARKNRELKAAQDARELAQLAAWNQQRTSINGITMTNAEAQVARQHVVDHGDAYADEAVRQGHIRADEKDAFKAAMRRKIELEDRRGRGILTPEEEREAAALDKSRMGRGLDAATANAHRDRGMGQGANAERTTANDGLKRSAVPAVADAAVFQDYTALTAAAPGKAPSPALAEKVKAMGLDL